MPLLTFCRPTGYYYYESYCDHTDTHDYASELPVQHNHETEGTEHNCTEDLQTDVDIPLTTDSIKVADGGEEESFIQSSQVIEPFWVLPILKLALHEYLKIRCFILLHDMIFL